MSSLVESLYYQTYSNVLLGKNENAKMYLHFLRDEYEQDSSSFDILKDGRWDHLRELGNIIDNNLLVKSFNVEKQIEALSITAEGEQTRTQNDLVFELCRQQERLRVLLKAEEDFCLISKEHQTLFGRVDLLAQDKKTFYPIELKKGIADHGIVGQIEKYILHFKLGLINKIYERVVGVVIANSFTDYALREIPRTGAIAIQYVKNNDKIELRRL